MPITFRIYGECLQGAVWFFILQKAYASIQCGLVHVIEVTGSICSRNVVHDSMLINLEMIMNVDSPSG